MRLRIQNGCAYSKLNSKLEQKSEQKTGLGTGLTQYALSSTLDGRPGPVRTAWPKARKGGVNGERDAHPVP